MNLELVNESVKVTQTSAFIDLEDTMITLSRKARIFPVIDSRTSETIGYYIIGDIYLGADTIVNTKKGAIGDPIEKLAKEAFIKSESADFSNTKTEFVNDREFRKIELDAFRNFEKISKNKFGKKNAFKINGIHYDFPGKIDDLDF